MNINKFNEWFKTNKVNEQKEINNTEKNNTEKDNKEKDNKKIPKISKISNRFSTFIKLSEAKKILNYN